MFVRTVEELERLGRIKSPLPGNVCWSARYLTAADGMGFSYNENRFRKGTEADFWMKHHWEATFIASGKGELSDLNGGTRWPLEPGVLYVVGPNDPHRLIASEDMVLTSTFCPALRGDEALDEHGSYVASGPPWRTDRRMFVKRGNEMRKAGKEMIVANGEARTLRMLTKADDIGFGFSDVNFARGAEARLWYKHHWEANHILSGSGEVEDLTTGEKWKLGPGVAYNVGPKDRHIVRAHTDMHYISIFCPPLVGNEQHDKDGALSPSGPVPPGPPGY